MRAAWVAVPVPAVDLLTYRVPDSMDLPAPGVRVLVPVGTRVLTGCVIRVDEAFEPGASRAESPPQQPPGDEANSDGATRALLDVLDTAPFLPQTVIDLVLWVADYYACGPGEAMAAAMPPFAWIESERQVQITEQGRRVLESGGDPGALGDGSPGQSGRPKLNAVQSSVLTTLGDGRARALGQVAAALRDTGTGRTHRNRVGEGLSGASATPIIVARSAVAALERTGLVSIARVIRGIADRSKTVPFAALTAAGLELATSAEVEKNVPGARQRDALAMLRGSPDGLPVSELRERLVSADTVRRLRARGLIALRRERVERDPFQAGRQGVVVPGARAEGHGSGRVLTGEQADVLARLGDLVSADRFETALLHGVTGSGKTEIYLRLAAQVREQGRRTLVLVPEIALTPALAATFRVEFADRVAVLHSGLSDGERHDQWQRIRRGEIDVVIGTRSAVFAPLPAIGLIVVDEEHDGSYKQEESPRYNGRDVAVMRAKREGALVVLGSATPAVETYQNAATGRYRLLKMERRVLDRPLAAVSLVDMREQYATAGPDLVFSESLQAAVAARLAIGEQVLVLLNRRGFASAVFCRQCGGTVTCPNCSVSLTVHRGATGRARCHYCNYSCLVPNACPECAAPYLEQIGLGTQRIEEEAGRLFPGARIARLDRDVLRRRGAAAELLARFGRREIDLLIGTQMIAKGHDFPRVTLVGVISADVGLGLPDFRAAERTFQLLTQVVGRAGRGETPGEAIIQTLYPDHYSVRHACQQDYESFFQEEIRFRQALRYPPIVALVNVIVRGPTFRAALDEATDLAERIREIARQSRELRILGPAPAPIGRIKGEHRVQFFIKGTHRAEMRDALKRALRARPDLRRRVTIDVDPLSVL